MEELNKASETLNKLREPEIITFQMYKEEFLYLGVDYIHNHSTDFVAVWDDFLGSKNGVEAAKPYIKEPFHHLMVVCYRNDTGDEIYMPGFIVENVKEIPDGLILKKFPACEFLVVTHTWSNMDVAHTFGIGNCGAYARTVEIPQGYIRYDGTNNNLANHVFSVENHVETENGFRHEWWVPIKNGDNL